MVTPCFLDTEFTSFDSPQLISIGLVCEGQEFYRELDDFSTACCNAFVLKNVLPRLTEPRVSRANLRRDLLEWFGKFKDPYLVSDAPQFDLELLYEVLHPWPPNIRPEAIRFPVQDWMWSEDTFQNDRLMMIVEIAHQKQMALGRPHHALDDSKALAKAWHAAIEAGWRPIK